MSKNLMIVESPHKAKTIEKFLGEDFHVLSSQGHIRDIEGVGRKAIGIDFDHGYQPNYVIDPLKAKLIETMRKEADKADIVWLASDADREGEAIAWHLKEVLQLGNQKTKRITFKEITPTAIEEALQNPRDIDYNLVNAQQARRVLDRIVGFELSPILWRKVTTGLSAGRVQSVAVRMVVEKEREIEEFVPTSQYRIVGTFHCLQDADNQSIKAELVDRFNTREEAEQFLMTLDNRTFEISDIQTKPIHRAPAPPFTTSTLQQEAARKLKYPVSKTMRIAQSLYENGLITYMRTDSMNLSSMAIHTAQQEVVAQYGSAYHKARQYKTASKGAQEAHEAIRPTYINRHEAGKTADEKKLYELIWKRTIACQMADAEYETTRVKITAPGCPYAFVAIGEVMTFDGFTRAYVQSSDDERSEETNPLPHIESSSTLVVEEFDAIQTYSKPPFRYNEASLVDKMEKLRIGRPSTYATIIETIQTRKYVERCNIPGKKREYIILTLKNHRITERKRTETYGQDNGKLVPTDLGRITNDFLVEQFPEIMNYDFTAKEEETFDQIALGSADWQQTVDAFYNTFHPAITAVPIGKVAGRLLGQDPKTGAPVFAKISKVGACVQIGDADHGKPKFVSLPKDVSLFTITLEQALQLYRESQPTVLCSIDGKNVVSGEGKYGPYLRYDNRFISIPKETQVHELTEAQIRDIIQTQDQEKLPLREMGDIQILSGRYGLYLKTPEGNFRLPKTVQVEQLTEEECNQIIESQKQKSHARRNS